MVAATDAALVAALDVDPVVDLVTAIPDMADLAMVAPVTLVIPEILATREIPADARNKCASLALAADTKPNVASFVVASTAPNSYASTRMLRASLVVRGALNATRSG